MEFKDENVSNENVIEVKFLPQFRRDRGKPKKNMVKSKNISEDVYKTEKTREIKSNAK